MYRSGLLFFAVFIVLAGKAGAQALPLPQLLSMLDWSPRQIDTTLVKSGYLLMQKDIDSATALYQYSNLDHKEKEPTTVRSLTYMDVTVREVKSRMITYRTYDKDEYADIAAWMLAHQYHMKDKFDFGNEQHALYTNGRQTIRLKVITTKLKGGRTFTGYELEIGK